MDEWMLQVRYSMFNVVPYVGLFKAAFFISITFNAQKGKNHFAPYSGFTPGTLVLNHNTPARQRYLPKERRELKQDNSIKRVTKMDKKVVHDGLSAISY